MGGGPGPTFDAMPSPNLLKSPIPLMVGGGRQGVTTFGAEPKSAKIPNSLYGKGGVCGGGRGVQDQLLIQSANLIKSQMPYVERRQ